VLNAYSFACRAKSTPSRCLLRCNARKVNGSLFTSPKDKHSMPG
jgi:hypothetical protein